MGNRNHLKPDMPSHTIEGKRDIITKAHKAMGEKAFLEWLKAKNIPSLRYFQEHVRKYKASYFRELFDKSAQ